MEEKNKMVSDYIIQLATRVNEQYKNLISKEKVLRAIEMFKDSSKEYDEIIKEIDKLVEKTIKDYLEEIEKRYDPELVKKNHEEIYSKLEQLTKKLNEKGIDYQLAGALCAYIKYGVESSRCHDDIDINLNEADIEKFRQVCEEMGLTFHDDRLTTPRVLKNGIPAGDHEVLATLDGSDFHIGVFCFERKPDGTIVNKGYYRDENGVVHTRNDIFDPDYASEIFGMETVDFRGQKLTITPPEYVYKLKKYTQKEKDLSDIQFMSDKIDKNKLARIEDLSKHSRIEHRKVDNFFGQKFNYHTHTSRSGHSEFVSDEEMLLEARKAGLSMIGFSEHIPNPELLLPDEDHRMLFSEIGDYISSINGLKSKYSDMTILSGFEAEFDPIRSSFLCDMKSNVDYMILGQHFVSRGLSNVPFNNNPNYPIEYANMVSKAIESGIFDIVAHPDLFMEYRDTIESEDGKKLFDENARIASQIICEKARDMGIPVELNLSSALNNNFGKDGNLQYPHPLFWEVASEIDGLQVLKGVDAHSLSAFRELSNANTLVSSIEEKVKDKMIKGEYNPQLARNQNIKLQEAFNKTRNTSLTFETHMISSIVNGTLSQATDDMTPDQLGGLIGNGLNLAVQGCVDAASQKDKKTVEEMSSISESSALSLQDKKGKLERKKKTLEETNNVLANQQRVVEDAKGNVFNAMTIGCEKRRIFKYDVTNDTA